MLSKAEVIAQVKREGKVAFRTQQFKNPYHMIKQSELNKAWDEGFEEARIERREELGLD